MKKLSKLAKNNRFGVNLKKTNYELPKLEGKILTLKIIGYSNRLEFGRCDRFFFGRATDYQLVEFTNLSVEVAH